MRPRTGAALILATALLAAGCSGGGDSDATTAQPTDIATTSASASESPGGETPSAEPSTQGQLPDGFPAEEVPLAEGEIGEVLVNDAVGSYLVTIYPDSDFPTAFEEATTRLTGAGFTQGPDVISAGPTSSTADFTSKDWFVVVTGGLPERIMLQYTIQPQ